MGKYKLVNEADANETHELEAITYKKALEEALEMLGYFIAEGGEDDKN